MFGIYKRFLLLIDMLYLIKNVIENKDISLSSEKNPVSLLQNVFI